MELQKRARMRKIPTEKNAVDRTQQRETQKQVYCVCIYEVYAKTAQKKKSSVK